MIRLKIIFLFLLFSSFSIRSYPQEVFVNIFMQLKNNIPQSDTIYYDFSHPLSWEDFQGQPDTTLSAGAMTASGFAFHSRIKYNRKEVHLSVGIYCFFNKHDSWRKPNINSEYHLLHEQHHFDITRIGAQKLLEALQKVHFTKDNYSALMNSIFHKVYDENIALQEQYDRETRNSIDVNKQLEWNDRIAAGIKKLMRDEP